jgi:hypothetical protein
LGSLFRRLLVSSVFLRGPLRRLGHLAIFPVLSEDAALLGIAKFVGLRVELSQSEFAFCFLRCTERFDLLVNSS